jgi:hypothetical protein
MDVFSWVNPKPAVLSATMDSFPFPIFWISSSLERNEVLEINIELNAKIHFSVLLDSENSTNDLISVAVEIDLIKNYLSLEKSRFHDKFDFELISTVPYNRKHTISKETLQLHDFAEITEDFANQQNLPRYPATPLNDEKTPLADVVDMDSVSGVKTANPANPVVHPAKIGDFLARKMADLKQAQDNPNAT